MTVYAKLDNARSLVRFDVVEDPNRWSAAWPPRAHAAESAPLPSLVLPRIADVAPTADARSEAWSRVPWTPLASIVSATHCRPKTTRTKVAWSPDALHLLFDCEDARLAAEVRADGDDLWKEDVLEIFLWPDAQRRVYFQYDLSPLGAELPLLVPSPDAPHGWSPWRYEGPRRVAKALRVEGGPARPGAAITRWCAEIRIPFALLVGVAPHRPTLGVEWRANFVRRDFEEGRMSAWAWSPRAGMETHAIDAYGSLSFGA